MNVRIIPDDFDPNIYNATTIHPLQSWEWGEARKIIGLKILRVGEFVGTKLEKAHLITLHDIPFTKYKIGYIGRSHIPSKEFIFFLKQIAKKENIIFYKFEPYEKIAKLKKLELTGLVKSFNPLFTQWTILLDISKSEDELNKNLKPKTRYNIKLAQKKGVIVKEESNLKGYEIFEKLYFETTKRQGYHGHDKNYHKTIWGNLKKKISHILIAYYNNIPLSAYEIFIYKNRGYYVYGGSSELHKNLMASNLLMWKSLLFCKKYGCTSFDMWGSLPKNYSQAQPYAGFTRFKEGYGGEFNEMIGSYDLVIESLIYKLYNTAYYLRKIYLKLKV